MDSFVSGYLHEPSYQFSAESASLAVIRDDDAKFRLTLVSLSYQPPDSE